jgi:hypothetical protein
MNEVRIWAEHPFYNVRRNAAYAWEAVVLPAADQTPIILPGKETLPFTVAMVKATYGEDAERLPEAEFQTEMSRRITHSESMLARLRDNWTGQNLSEWHVYASILRPMFGIRVEGAVFLNGDGAKYEQYTIHTYVVSREPLDEAILKHLTLVPISHP